jgi:hypothetical protein
LRNFLEHTQKQGFCKEGPAVSFYGVICCHTAFIRKSPRKDLKISKILPSGLFLNNSKQ